MLIRTAEGWRPLWEVSPPVVNKVEHPMGTHAEFMQEEQANLDLANVVARENYLKQINTKTGIKYGKKFWS